ncbi:MAG: OmpA family protein [Prevotella sp.]|nr:OmpA family protein [Prevotella sp.]
MKHLRIISIVALLLTIGLTGNAQEEEKVNNSTWYFGIGGGYRLNHMSFSGLDKTYFPTSKFTGSGMFSVFVQGEFGRQNNFAIRPQVSFLNRGGKLTEINKSSYGEDIDDINYKLKAHYVDIRVPLIYNFCNRNSVVRPYVFIAPVLGFSYGGKINLEEDDADATYSGYQVDVSKASMSSVYFAGQAGLGVKFAIPVGDNRCFLGVEASYEYGFTDTYSGKEKDSESYDVAQLFSRSYKINGSRKLSGIEFQAVLSIPFSVFKSKKKPAPPVERPVYIEPVPEPIPEPMPEPVVEEDVPPCYSLEEIIALIDKGENVEGKTICAIDAINFDFAKSTIQSASYEYLDKVAATIIRSNKAVEVKGHTDNVGSEEFNMNLSKERAEAVVEYLAGKGVSRDRLTYSYYGESKPRTTNDTEEGRAMNRRVEFTILNN